MREPIVDLILLVLLVLFFGWEQRRRPELQFRFWLVGWVLVLFSVLCGNISAGHSAWSMALECVRQDSIACGGLAFVFSFLVSDRRWRLSLRGAILLGIPICAALDLEVLHAAPTGVMYGLILVGEWISIATSYRFMRKAEAWFFPLVTCVCVGFGSCMLYAMWRGWPDDLLNFVLAQLFVASGLLFARSRLHGGRLIGGCGFIAWGGFYAATAGVFLSGKLAFALHSVWPVPRYIAGVGLVLTIYEASQAEIASLSVLHRRLYEEYRVLFMSNPHPMWIYDSSTARFLAANDSASSSYGFSTEEFLGMSVTEIEVPERGGATVADERQGMKRAGRHRRADGTTLDVDVTDHDIIFEGHAARFMLAVDTTEREMLHRELVRQARHDVLTGLPNRSMLDDRIEQCLSRCMREDKKGAVLTVDIDHFKKVNDTFGHLVGDDCLKATAERLSSRVRQVDTIARTGGEEFTIVIGGLGSRVAAEKVCSEMLGLFDTPVVCGEHELRVTVSIGVALFPDHAVDVEGLRRRSDQALYEAKRLGRNQAVFASAVTV